MKNLTKLTLEQLIHRIESAPDFGYDDEEIEMRRRGIKYKWSDSLSNPKIIIV